MKETSLHPRHDKYAPYESHWLILISFKFVGKRAYPPWALMHQLQLWQSRSLWDTECQERVNSQLWPRSWCLIMRRWWRSIVHIQDGYEIRTKHWSRSGASRDSHNRVIATTPNGSKTTISRQLTHAGPHALAPCMLKRWVPDNSAIVEPRTTAATTGTFAGFLFCAALRAHLATRHECTRYFGPICRHEGRHRCIRDTTSMPHMNQTEWALFHSSL